MYYSYMYSITFSSAGHTGELNHYHRSIQTLTAQVFLACTEPSGREFHILVAVPQARLLYWDQLGRWAELLTYPSSCDSRIVQLASPSFRHARSVGIVPGGLVDQGFLGERGHGRLTIDPPRADPGWVLRASRDEPHWRP